MVEFSSNREPDDEHAAAAEELIGQVGPVEALLWSMQQRKHASLSALGYIAAMESPGTTPMPSQAPEVPPPEIPPPAPEVN